MSKKAAGAEIVIVSILPKLELKAIISEIEKKWPDASESRLAGNTRLYHITNSQGWDLKLAARAIYDAGNLNSAIETTSMLSRFKPAFAFLCGIAGNLNHEKRRLGDVVVSDSYAFQAYTRMSDGERLEVTMPPVPPITNKMRDLAHRVFSEIRINFNGRDLPQYISDGVRLPEVEVEMGKLFCWDLVLDCDKKRRELIAADREYRAVEMEAAGFFKAIKSFSDINHHSVDGLVFRGLSDPACGKATCDIDHRVKWRPYAARNAARTLVHFIDNLSEQDCFNEGF